MSVDESEIDDARNELRRFGFDEHVFTFTPTPYKYLGTGVERIVADMTVMNSANGTQKTYDAGHGSSWPAAFGNDLRAGVFGRPPGG